MARTQPRPKKRMCYMPWVEQVLFLNDKNITFSYVQPRNPMLENQSCQPADNDHTVVNRTLSTRERERLAKIIAVAYTKKDLRRLNDTKKVYLGIMKAGVDPQERLLIKIAKCCKSTFKVHMTKTNGNITESVLLSREYLWDFMK